MSSTKKKYLFTSSQLIDILNTTPSIKTQISIIGHLGPRLTDPKSRCDDILSRFRFSEEKRSVEEILRMRTQTLSASMYSVATTSTTNRKSDILLRGGHRNRASKAKTLSGPISPVSISDTNPQPTLSQNDAPKTLISESTSDASIALNTSGPVTTRDDAFESSESVAQGVNKVHSEAADTRDCATGSVVSADVFTSNDTTIANCDVPAPIEEIASQAETAVEARTGESESTTLDLSNQKDSAEAVQASTAPELVVDKETQVIQEQSAQEENSLPSEEIGSNMTSISTPFGACGSDTNDREVKIDDPPKLLSACDQEDGVDMSTKFVDMEENNGATDSAPSKAVSDTPLNADTCNLDDLRSGGVATSDSIIAIEEEKKESFFTRVVSKMFRKKK